MKQKIGIVNYGIAGNIHSVSKAISEAGGEIIVINSPEQFSLVDKIVIPGVGGFKGAMEELQNHKFTSEIKEFAGPILGICLGMQLFSDLGFEHGESEGLGLIRAEVRPVICNKKVPHMGFGKIEVVNNNKILNGVENEEFYFMHSYEVVNYTDIASLTNYGNHVFISSIKKDNIYGVQFHPEKSREAGIKLFANFVNL